MQRHVISGKGFRPQAAPGTVAESAGKLELNSPAAQASQTPLWWDAPRQILTTATLRYTLGAATRIILLEGAPARTMPADICFPPSRQFAKLSRNETPVGSLHLFKLGISTIRWPYPPHYRTAFAFSDLLYPLHLPFSLRSGYHSSIECGAHRVYPVDCCGDALRLGWGLSPGGDYGCCCLPLPTDSPPHVAILATAYQPLWPLATHEMFNPSHTFNLPVLP